ncbi:MAG: S-methyl-5'-thioinosine phosphorylase [Gammaproteobacteria bacterium]|nr:S-methyl-5'-thioinosine phosphorylase [Gammaproteobacteria bacterium]
MSSIGIIGGSGLDQLAALTDVRARRVTTAWGEPSGPLLEGRLDGTPVIFLPRHGAAHHLPPHRINYRANIAALRDAGVKEIFAVAAVGGIGREAAPGALVVPDQIIDYTWGREHTFHDGLDGQVEHVEFGEPFCPTLRNCLIEAARALGQPLVAQGCYGATQGPRLETAAEIARMARDGCTLVGMTGMPEAALAREAGLAYASCSLVVNWAAGLSAEPITMEDILRELREGMGRVLCVLSAAVRLRQAAAKG